MEKYNVKNNLYQGFEILLSSGKGVQLKPRPSNSTLVVDKDEVKKNVQIQNLVNKGYIKLIKTQ